MISIGRREPIETNFEYGISPYCQDFSPVVRLMANRWGNQGNSLAAFLKQLWMIRKLNKPGKLMGR